MVHDDRTVHVGTSGWSYEHWRQRFYPKGLPGRDRLAFYATRFATTELNGSFYRLPRPADVDAWRATTPPRFTMAVKASRYLTHIRRLQDPDEPLQRLWALATRLGPKLGPVLFQTPPNLPVELDRLRGLLHALPSRMRPAFEFREPSWFTQDVFELLRGRDAALVWADRAGRTSTRTSTASWSYVRLHQGRRSAPGYTRHRLERWADDLAQLGERPVWLYFNNDQEGAAVRDADTLIDMLRTRGVEVAVPRSGPGSGLASRASG